MLALPEYGQLLVQLLNGVDNLSAAVRELLPVDKGLSSHCLQDVIEVLFHCVNLDFSHVEDIGLIIKYR